MRQRPTPYFVMAITLLTALTVMGQKALAAPLSAHGPVFASAGMTVTLRDASEASCTRFEHVGRTVHAGPIDTAARRTFAQRGADTLQRGAERT